MDKLESLSNTISQMTLYDVKSMYTQAKNMVLNVSETEAKVREATNDDPWGASSTLMQEIAQGTFNFHQFNEIMPCIYSRFMEKEARQWRQIYKALQLMEYLIKHGSERVVDDARAHISTLKMLRNFHYIDDKGKDEGSNVRNRARELVELLSDVEKIRGERRKAKANRHKYTGAGNDGFDPSFQSGGSRYGGFGSDSLSTNNDFYRSNLGSSSGGFRDDARRGGFEEYDAGDDEDVQKSKPSQTQSSSSRNKATPPEPAPAAAPVVDLLGGLDDETSNNTTTTATTTAPSTANKALPAVNHTVGLDDDEFADFQAAPVQASTVTAGAAAPMAPAKPNLMDLLNAGASQPAPFTSIPVQQPSLFKSPMGGIRTQSTTMHRPSSSVSFTSSPIQPTQTGSSFIGATSTATGTLRPMSATSSKLAAAQIGNAFTGITPTATGPVRSGSVASSIKPTSTQSKPSSNFDDLWSLSLGTSSKPANSTGTKSIKDLEKEKSQASLWGSQTKPNVPMGRPAAFGSFGGSTLGSGGQSNGGSDDLLL